MRHLLPSASACAHVSPWWSSKQQQRPQNVLMSSAKQAHLNPCCMRELELGILMLTWRPGGWQPRRLPSVLQACSHV